MKHDALEKMLNVLGRSLFEHKERVTIDLLGSSALVLGYKCWANANDVDARWSQDDSFVLCPLIEEIGAKFHHSKGARWMNSDIADIVYQDGTWARTVEYGYLRVRIPTPEFLMSTFVQALQTCHAGDEQYPPFGKAAAQCKALAGSQGWGKDDIVQHVAVFFPRGIPPACDEWLNRIFASSTSSSYQQDKRQELFEPVAICGNL